MDRAVGPSIITTGTLACRRVLLQALRLHAAQVSYPSHRGGDDTLQCPFSKAAPQKPGELGAWGARWDAAASREPLGELRVAVCKRVSSQF